MPEVLESIDSRLIVEAPAPDAARIKMSALTLAGMRLATEKVLALRKSLRSMNILKDSSFYQGIRQEAMEEGRKVGRKEGLAQGQYQGRIEGAREILFRLGRIRFGRLDRATRTAIEAIDDLGRIDQLSERLLTAKSWSDLLAESE